MIISVQNVKRPVSVIETECVCCALRLRYFSTIRIHFLLNADRQEYFFPFVFAKEVNLNQGSGSFPAACDNQGPGLAWPGLSPTTSAMVNVPVSPIAMEERR